VPQEDEEEKKKKKKKKEKRWEDRKFVGKNNLKLYAVKYIYSWLASSPEIFAHD
jgi:hypothetical protein